MLQRALFLFRRDLRLVDNTGLIHALKTAQEIIPAFILTPEQIDSNPYRSNACLQFMIESLEDLSEQLKAQGGKLYLFHGHCDDIVERCIRELKIDALFVNKDYTPFSIQRDQKLAALCKKHKVEFHSFDDALLNPPELTLKSDQKPYTVFTPFYRNASKIKVKAPEANRYRNYSHCLCSFAETPSIYKKILPKRKDQMLGGRKAGLALLKSAARLKSDTHLSAHLKFTTVSIREVYRAFRKKTSLIRALYWRDFFSGIAFYFPRVFKGAFRENYNRIRWRANKKLFRAWCEGKTGFPIVDAGMRQMNETGYMPNRLRMITASFLVKDLHIDWRLGEKYFAQQLIDYDPAVNNGNWQWCASTGCDAVPYFRIFNPWSQQKKFDPDCKYIKTWIPELKSLSSEEIHNWQDEQVGKIQYPAPLVDHSTEAKFSLNTYRSL